MLTIGKTSEGNQTSLTMTLLTFAKIGKLEPSLGNMRRDALCKQPVQEVTVGKNKNFTRTLIRQDLAKMKNVMDLGNAKITTEIMTEDM